MTKNEKLLKTGETEANGIPDFTVRAFIGFVNVFGGTGRQPARVDSLKRVTKYAIRVEEKPNAQPECQTSAYTIFTGKIGFQFEIIEWLDQVQRKHSSYKIYNPTHQILVFLEETIGFDMPITKVDFVYEMTTPAPEALFELIAPSIF